MVRYINMKYLIFDELDDANDKHASKSPEHPTSRKMSGKQKVNIIRGSERDPAHSVPGMSRVPVFDE
jgi:hypothetical protein